MFNYKILRQSDDDPIRQLQDWYISAIDTGGTWGTWDGDLGGTGQIGDWLGAHRHHWFKWIKNYRVAIQLGGNVGFYPRILSDAFDYVYTFEPDPEAFTYLVMNCQKDNIIKFNCALGKEITGCHMNRMPELLGCNSIAGKDSGHIPMLTLDTFNFHVVDLLALDTEGYEEHILRGGLETVARCQPVITCENGENLNKLWEEIGYKKVAQSSADGVYTPRSW